MNGQLQAIGENRVSMHSLKSIFKQRAAGPMAEVCDSNNEQHQRESLLSHDALDRQYTISSHPSSELPSTETDSTINAAEQVNVKEASLQGIVFLEDAFQYRSIHHKASYSALCLYRWFHSASTKYSVHVATFLILILAFFEDPSSLSWSSDPRRNYTRVTLPYGFTEGIELVCLLILTTSNIIKGVLISRGNDQKSFIRQNPWLAFGFVVLLLSFTDVIISLALGAQKYRIRVRRLFRPYFLIQNTTMLKKTLKAMWNTVPEIISVLTLLSLHLYFFTMLGMLLFPHSNANNNGTSSGGEFNSTEWKTYFSSVDTALMSLVVLLTTANNPDVMIPAYSENRLYAIYFITYSLIGTFLIFNLLTAIIYNQFRGYFKCSMQTSYFRRCVALSAAFRSLSKTTDPPEENVERPCVSIAMVGKTVKEASMTADQRHLISLELNRLSREEALYLNERQFCSLFQNIDTPLPFSWGARANVPVWNSACMRLIQRLVLHRFFNIVGNFIVLLNAVLMTAEIAIHYEEAFRAVFSRLNIMNYVFVGYYCIEQVLKIMSMGKTYFFKWDCLYDGVISIALVTVELVQLAQYGGRAPHIATSGLSLWDCARIVNILVLLRLLRIIPNIKPMALVTGVMLEIIRSLRSFAGIIVIIYYVFAILGMMFFEGKISPPPGLPIDFTDSKNGSYVTLAPPVSYECGTYEQLNYWPNNFNDFASSLVVLWDVMVVNNWEVFLIAFKKEVNPWSQLYFVAWWLISAVVCINLFVALILDHFIAKWDGNLGDSGNAGLGTIQSLFRHHLTEPSQQRVDEELAKHPSLRCNVCVS